ncbi:MAG TPA: EcsC family protein [Thermoanaerobaculia bacterium]|jgi:hypothetical protein|nr:EcsC family protein [Thermoanaerobaculia bacterium]
MTISDADLRQLQQAHDLLENPRLTARMIAALGRPIELALVRLPSGLQGRVHTVAQSSIEKALDVAIRSLSRSKPPGSKAHDRRHKVFTAASGAVGGAFGLAGLAVELPVSTTAMLRSIADIARSQGEDLRSPEARLSCLQVFALGGPSRANPADTAGETGYYAIRLALSATIKELAQVLAERGAVREGTPALVRFVTTIAARYGVTVSEKVAAQAVPVLGAVGGAAINVLFIDHYQDLARGHFTVRRLERTYSAEVIRKVYQELGRSNP